ncbi:MAG: hypothetical protein KJ901_10945 [Gammaproteobacteria bacterium]|nr:hypothetical protein [Gammaproteobacteria bacterium]MBU1444108.1 hypothetical protein [Gammaproteobacteria bacterium]
MASEDQLDAVLASVSRVLRPLVRLALALGAKHAHLEAVLRHLLVDEARRAWRETGVEANISQLSVTTGLNRKALTAKLRSTEDALPRTETSAAAKTFTLWLQLFADDPACRSLPIVADSPDQPSFESVARRASRGNVHHRAILDELTRLNLATQTDGRVELVASGFVPAQDLQAMLSFVGDNGRDHLLAAVANTLGAPKPFLERSVFVSGIPLEDCEHIHRLARDRWSQLHREFTREMTRAYERAPAEATGRLRVGIYTYYEDDAAGELPPADPAASPASKRDDT